jgi:hypothetical protein
LRPEEGWTRHPQVGNCGARVGASMFTPVNFRCINKIGDWLNERGSERSHLFATKRRQSSIR